MVIVSQLTVGEGAERQDTCSIKGQAGVDAEDTGKLDSNQSVGTHIRRRITGGIGNHGSEIGFTPSAGVDQAAHDFGRYHC